MYDIEKWVYTVIFGVLAILIIGNNLFWLIRSKIKNDTTSFTLFLGAFFGVISILTAPIQSFKWLAFLPILIDPGTSLVLFSFIKNKNI
jgi:threonine/homoserine/homoserine lactone efflux protein